MILQFAYRANRSVDDAINLALHHILQHLDSPGTYARVLFVDFSSAFNTILPSLLQDKLSQLNVPDSTCSHDSVKLIKFADDTTLIGLISNNDESAYRREVDRLVSWCSGNNLELNAQKTVEMIVDFRKSTVPPPPPSVMDSPITSVESFRFLGTTITQDLKWEPTISSLIKKAQQRMYFLRQLRKAKLPAQMLVQFYTAIIESILTSSITVWFAGATVRDKQRLQRIVRSAEEVIGRSLPSLQDLFDDLVRRYIDENMSYQQLLGEGAIWLLRYDFTFEWPRPIMPNMVFIGGINCAKTSPLPADLEEFVEGSGEHGIIVFTMGSMVSDMPIEIAKRFFDAFRQLPQRVLWRYEGEIPADAPKNVMPMKWLPQNDLLAHPKARLFMTHGGTHGIYEGVCNGVPMLMFPLFGDQRDNVHRMVAKGVAEQLLIYDLSTESLVTALKKMLNDKRYQENMQTLSSLHNDRPVPPLDLAVFWTEFVLRHKGADHLRVAAHNLNWIQYFCLDVLAFLALIVFIVVWITVKCCLFCTRTCCGRGTVKKKQA
uniref:glucuronosyltransferase n=1 Tax=Knipowitschia caucasica TaxID=637954 RepID=A0AAV2JYY0_KNICA